MKNCPFLSFDPGIRLHHPSLTVAGFALAVIMGFSRQAEGQVYEWTDPKGTRHFSSEKRGEQFKIAVLPPLHREKSVKGIEKKGPSGEKALVGCHDHGGINCQAGADGDGSVVCLDGFRDAAAPFRFFCFMPKLAVSEVIPGKEPGTASIVVRNESGVAAIKPVITFPSSFGSPKISGPDSIPPREVGEFLVLGITGAPSSGEVSISCQNCG